MLVEGIALAVVVAAGLFLLALGGASLVAPSSVSRFLLGFAGSAAKHYTELALRFLVGGALVCHAPRMLFPGGFSFFGWVLLGTTAALLLIPWRWHRSFAQRAVPQALQVLPLIGAVSMVLGVLVLLAVFRGNVA